MIFKDNWREIWDVFKNLITFCAAKFEWIMKYLIEIFRNIYVSADDSLIEAYY